VPPQNPPWPQWQGRLSFGTTTPLFSQDAMNTGTTGIKLSGATLLGDYYFTRTLRLGNSGGFRATSGVVVPNERRPCHCGHGGFCGGTRPAPSMARAFPAAPNVTAAIHQRADLMTSSQPMLA
jgi:hypothetical protein